MATHLTIETEFGAIRLRLRPDAAPVTVGYITECVKAGLYDGHSSFYRSDFVIQCGLHGSGVHNPNGDLPVNEAKTGTILSNTRGTAAIAHWDVPDCGNTEFFINLSANAHLDHAYGGYCVFAVVEDDASFGVVDKIASVVKGGVHPKISRMQVQ